MIPRRTEDARNRAPFGATVVPSGESVVKQRFRAMMIDGYIDLKSSTTTHG